MAHLILDTAVLAVGAELWQKLLLPIGLVLIFLSIGMGIRKRRHRTANPISPREHLERNDQQRGLRDDLERLMLEIEEMAKRLGAQLDAKSIHMERLLHEADQRIAEMKRAGDAPDQRAGQSATAAPPDRPAAAPPAEPEDPVARSVYQLADQGLDPPAIARKLDEHVGKVELILALRQAG